MSGYTNLLRDRITHGEANWDLTVRENRRELARLRFRLWWYSGPSLVVAGMVGTGVGMLIGFFAVQALFGGA